MAGISGADKRNRTPGRRTAAHAPLAIAPTTVSTPPASKGSQRGRTARASRIRPMPMSSAPIRIHLRIRLVRVSLSFGAPSQTAEPPDGVHTTRFRRCARSLMVASGALTPRCVASMVRPRTGHHEQGEIAGRPARSAAAAVSLGKRDAGGLRHPDIGNERPMTQARADHHVCISLAAAPIRRFQCPLSRCGADARSSCCGRRCPARGGRSGRRGRNARYARISTGHRRTAERGAPDERVYREPEG